MAAKKMFINSTTDRLQITLFIRLGAQPTNSAGTQVFLLAGNERKDISYGLDTNSLFLNGIELVWQKDGSTFSQGQKVVSRGNSLDSVLNTNSIITISSSSTSGLSISGSNH